jgi:hypothetical protein
MNLFSLNTQLNQAQLVLEEQEEYKTVQNPKSLIQKEIDELTSALPELQKEALKELGFECRTGYTIELDPPNLNELLEDYTHCIILKNALPFKLIWFSGNHDEWLHIQFEGSNSSCEWSYCAIGLGSSEDKAWSEALWTLKFNWEESNSFLLNQYKLFLPEQLGE